MSVSAQVCFGVTWAVTDPEVPFPVVGGRAALSRGESKTRRLGGHWRLFLRSQWSISADVGCWDKTQPGCTSLPQPWRLEAEVRGLADPISGRAPSRCRCRLRTVSTGGQSELRSLFPGKGTNPIMRFPPPGLPKAPPPDPAPLGVWVSQDGSGGDKRSVVRNRGHRAAEASKKQRVS